MNLQNKIVALLLCIPAAVFSQRGNNSIYSYYGIGDVHSSAANGFSGMANAATSLRSRHALNDDNPASYTALPQRQFSMELSLGGNSTTYSTSSGTQKGGDFSFQSLAVAFNASPKYTTAFSLKPFSKVDYQIASKRSYAGLDEKVEEQLKGSGGLYQMAWSNALALNKRQAIGISTGFIFGSINSKQDVFGNSNENEAALIVEKNKFLRQFFWKIGAISEYPVGKSTLAFGLTYQPGISLASTEDVYLKDAAENILYSETENSGRFAFPGIVRAGISLSGKHNVISADYLTQQWGNSYRGTNFTSNNSNRVAIGYMHKKLQQYYTSHIEGLIYQAGAYYERGYLQVRGHYINEVGFTAGVSIPNASHILRYNIFINAGQRGVLDYPLVKEKFFKFGVALNFKNFMLNPKVKYYD